VGAAEARADGRYSLTSFETGLPGAICRNSAIGSATRSGHARRSQQGVVLQG
jgi:hypothetical protein